MARQAFDGLDGLRGVAALSVGVLHADGLILHCGFNSMTFLAVDFFFCLSGFVLSHAYGARLTDGTLGPGRFFVLRLCRLYPMILAGAVLAVAVGLAMRTGPMHETLTMGLGTLLLVPAGFAFGDIAFPLNNVFWSLLFELGAGAVFACLASSRGRVWVMVAAASAAILLIVAAKGVGPGLLGFGNPVLFLFGAPRVLLPFALGVLVERQFAASEPGRTTAPLLPALLLVTVLFCIPGHRRFTALIATVVAVPLIVWLGARATPLASGRRSALMRHVGAVSYPFYAVHLPLVLLAGAVAARADLGMVARWALSAAALTAAWLLSWWLERQWDQPARTSLARRAAAYQALIGKAQAASSS
ncbi:MAG: acyltransferase [Novosphingobium sp.]|nr:acyltransferase [Novosphingobium sp.]